MKKRILYFILFMFLIVIPTKVFGITGSLFKYAENTYKVKVTNPDGAKIYVKGNWCPDCKMYQAYTLEFGEEVDVVTELYDYRKYIDSTCSNSVCSFLNVRPDYTKLIKNEEEYKSLLKEGNEYDNVKESDLKNRISYYAISIDDVELTNNIVTNEEYMSQTDKTILSFGENNASLYSNSSIMSNKLATISSGTKFSKVEESYFESWYKVTYNGKTGWVNVDDTNSFYFLKPSKESLSLESENKEYNSVQLSADITVTKNNHTYTFPKDLIINEFYYSTNFDQSSELDEIVVEYKNEFFGFNKSQFNICYDNSCSKNDIVIIDENNSKSIKTNLILAILSIVISLINIVILIILIMKRKKN